MRSCGGTFDRLLHEPRVGGVLACGLSLTRCAPALPTNGPVREKSGLTVGLHGFNVPSDGAHALTREPYLVV